MSQEKTTARRRLKLWQRMFIVVVLIMLLSMSGTLITGRTHPADAPTTESAADTGQAVAERAPVAQPEDDRWTGSVYIIAAPSEFSVPFYNEALAEKARCPRGAYVLLESWEPFVAENGTEYYHIYWDGDYGYVRTENVSDDKSEIVQETQVYVRTAVNLMASPDSYELGLLAQKGDLLRIVGYDYITASGKVNMYEVKLGTDIGWIHADYVAGTYAEALENWTSENNSYQTHVLRGDPYGGGDAADLDYWPHEKGDFADVGNVMPDACYCQYVAIRNSDPEHIRQYLEYSEGTSVNTFVFTIFDDEEMAYNSAVAASYGLLDQYSVKNTREQFAESVRMVQEAGYYTVARVTAFKDYALAKNYPQWAITDLSGQPLTIDASYWPSVYCRDVWAYKAQLALEAVELYGFNEVQFDYVRFPNYLLSYENKGTVDLKNEQNESKAQAVQRFLIYVTDLLHGKNVYVSADVFGETSNDYVAPYGQYWPAISTVVDAISGMPYPDHYDPYYLNGSYFTPYQHPYYMMNQWGLHVMMRQEECSTPAAVRTWIQTWDDARYTYDSAAIMREIVALYDTGVTGGYIPWYGNGSLAVIDKLLPVYEPDYYALWLEAEAEGVTLSKYMDFDTAD